MEIITSGNNKKVKNLMSLLNKSKERRKQELFIAEGIKMFLEAPMEKIREVFISLTFFEEKRKEEDFLWNKIKSCQLYILSDKLFRTVTDTTTPQGIIFTLEHFNYSQENMFNIDNPMFIIVEDIQDPGNLGTMIRTAEAAGVSGVFMTKNTVDIYNPKTVRSTMGAIYRVPYIYMDNLEETLITMKKNNITIYAAHLGGIKNYVASDYTKGCAFLIGNEGNGLTKEIVKYADHLIKIPMAGEAESLNAAVAAAILMYEAARQRM